MSALRRYHAAVWDEPIVMEMGAPGRRGVVPPRPDPAVAEAVPDPLADLPAGLRRDAPPALPELSEFEVQRHYLHLAQQTLGMMGISLFGTCTMKYNPRVSEELCADHRVAEVHPLQPDESIQGLLQIIYELDQSLQHVSGMDRFVFQPGGGAHAAYTHLAVTRAYFAARGELDQRREVITTVQAHPCNPATADAAGFDVITLPIEENGYASLDALQAAVSERTACLMVNNPDDMGIYNPEIAEWVEVVHQAGGLCFYDHANFNGVMTRVRAADLGFDACMFMLHKTFGSPKGGGGPATGAYGCNSRLAPYLVAPYVDLVDGQHRIVSGEAASTAQIREYLGNVPVVVRAYAWLTAMGTDGMRQAANISVLANNYMEQRLLEIPGVAKAYPGCTEHRLEMTRYSLAGLTEETGVTTVDIQNRMTDFGVDAYWLSHEPWFVPEPFTPEAGELWSLEDIDYWIDVLAHVVAEARRDPQLVRSAPHSQVVHRPLVDSADDPNRWATTWRAHLRKHLTSTTTTNATASES